MISLRLNASLLTYKSSDLELSYSDSSYDRFMTDTKSNL